MRERNPRHIALGVLGLLGALLYVLACRPAWRPDSSKVLFTYSNAEGDQSGVALYDRNTGAVRSIFSRKSGKDESDALLSVAWSGDGSRAIILLGNEREKKRKNPATGKKETVDIWLGHVEVLPVEGAGKKLHFKLHHFLLDDSFFMFPLAEAGGKLYLSGPGERGLLQLDLKTGKQKSRALEDDRELLLLNHNGHIDYARGGAENSNDLEFGELDTKDLSLHSRFVLKEKKLEAQGVSDSTPFPAFEPHGSRMAMPAQGVGKQDLILMCNAHGLERVFEPELSNSAFSLGNLQWSRDGKTLYATVVTPTVKNGIVQFSLGEIPVAGGPVRLTPILRANGSLEDNELMSFQISISPDGSTIAASTGYFAKGDIDPADRGLFLVDLRDPQRRVTRIQYPPMTGKKDTARR